MAGHELKGLTSCFLCGVDGLNFPLIALIDYRGFRLVCMSVLPIDEDTLVCGSADGGAHVPYDAGLGKKIDRIGR